MVFLLPDRPISGILHDLRRKGTWGKTRIASIGSFQLSRGTV